MLLQPDRPNTCKAKEEHVDFMLSAELDEELYSLGAKKWPSHAIGVERRVHPKPWQRDQHSVSSSCLQLSGWTRLRADSLILRAEQQ